MDSLFKPVLDISEGTLTANQVQGVFGEFKPVLDSAQGAVGTVSDAFMSRLMMSGMGN